MHLGAVHPVAIRPDAVRLAAVHPVAVRLAVVHPVAVRLAAVRPVAVRLAAVRLAAVHPVAVHNSCNLRITRWRTPQSRGCAARGRRIAGVMQERTVHTVPADSMFHGR